MQQRERLARAIHDAYVRQKQTAGAVDSERVLEWDELPEPLKESSRQHADDIPAKLARIGCRLAAARSPNAVRELTADEIELLARLEHERWCTERRAAGWQLGAATGGPEPRSPWLVRWRDLPEDQREMDRALMRALPKTVADAGFAIVRQG
jgi:RyR domain